MMSGRKRARTDSSNPSSVADTGPKRKRGRPPKRVKKGVEKDSASSSHTPSAHRHEDPSHPTEADNSLITDFFEVHNPSLSSSDKTRSKRGRGKQLPPAKTNSSSASPAHTSTTPSKTLQTKPPGSKTGAPSNLSKSQSTRKQSGSDSPDLEPLESEEEEEEEEIEEEGRKKGQVSKKSANVRSLPRSLLKNLFSLYSKRRMTREATDLIVKFSEDYLRQASEDLAVYARHAGRKTILVDDVVLLLQRQRMIDSSPHSFEHAVNTYLPMEYAEELLPCPLMMSQK